jgi:transposase InsO family protein
MYKSPLEAIKRRFIRSAKKQRRRFATQQTTEETQSDSLNELESTVVEPDNELHNIGNFAEFNPEITTPHLGSHFDFGTPATPVSTRTSTSVVASTPTNPTLFRTPSSYNQVGNYQNASQNSATATLPWNYTPKVQAANSNINHEGSATPNNIHTPNQSMISETVNMNVSRKQYEEHMVKLFVQEHLKDTSTVDFPWRDFIVVQNATYANKVAQLLRLMRATPASIGKMTYGEVLDLVSISSLKNQEFEDNDAITVAAQLYNSAAQYLKFEQKMKPEESEPGSLDFIRKLKSYKGCKHVRTTLEHMIQDLSTMFSYFAQNNVAMNERVPLLARCCDLEPATRLKAYCNQVNTGRLSDEELLRALPQVLNSAITIDMHMQQYLALDSTQLDISQEAYALLHCTYGIILGISNERQISNYIRSLPDSLRMFATQYSEGCPGISFHDLYNRVNRVNTDRGKYKFFRQHKTNHTRPLMKIEKEEQSKQRKFEEKRKRHKKIWEERRGKPSQYKNQPDEDRKIGKRRNSTRFDNQQQNRNDENATEKQGRERNNDQFCTFCKIPGHDIGVCRKKAARDREIQVKDAEKGSQPKTEGGGKGGNKFDNSKKRGSRYETVLNLISEVENSINTASNIERAAYDVENNITSGKFAKKNFNFEVVPDQFQIIEKLPPLRTMRASIEGVAAHALLDTGSQRSHISQEFYNAVCQQNGEFTPEMTQKIIQVRYANNTVEFGKEITLHVKANGKGLQHTFIVLQNPTYDVIFGLDILDALYVTVADILNQKVKTLMDNYKAHTIDEILEAEDLKNNDGVVFHDTKESFEKEIQESLTKNEATSTKHSTLCKISIEFENEEDRKRGCWSKQIPIPVNAQEEVLKQVEQWLKENIIEEILDLKHSWKYNKHGNGLFNTNGFLTFSGKWRFVHNFVPINKLIKNDTNDLPSIDTIFRTIGSSGAMYFTKIDLRSAYLQILLRKRDRDITAFTIGNRRFRFVTAPLGLKHIPSVFQRSIQALLQEKECWAFANNFIDDIIVFSKTYEEHIEHVKKVLDALTEKSLTIRRDKCHFNCKAVPLLGFWLEEQGVRPNMKKIMNMEEWERPNTRKRVQRFCGIVNFFRRFVPKCSHLLQPIMSIREKSFIWESKAEYEEAYQNIIQALVKNVPFLYFPVPGIPIELETDASETALGAALFQVVNGEKRYISFHSRVLSHSEVRYSMPKKELLSIIVHTRFYKPYLLGNRFILHTDAQALTYVFDKLQDTKSKNSTLHEWISVLAEFDFEVRHIKGTENTLADLTSRVQSILVEPVEGDADIIALIKHIHKMGHFGANAIFNQIREHLEGETPKNLLSMIKEYIKQCKVCGLVNDYRVGYSPLKKPTHVMPCEYVHMDLLQLKQSTRRFNYVLTIVDYFTGFVWLTPLRTKEMEEVYKAVLKTFLTFGFPEKIKTDNGKEFVNRLFTEMCERIKIDHKKVIAYNHHANGRVERQNRTIRATLRKILEDCGKTSANIWDEFIPAVQFAMNARIHSGMKSSPFSLMFGRGPLNIRSTDWDKLDIDDDREKMLEFWKLFKTMVPKQIQELRVRNYERQKYHRKTIVYSIGDIVRWKNAREENLKFNFQGPFKIVKFIGDEQRYIIKNADGERISTPANFLKPSVDTDGILDKVGIVETVDNPVPTFLGEEDNGIIFVDSDSETEIEQESAEQKTTTEIRSRKNRKRTRTSTAQREKNKRIKLDNK